MLRHLPDRFAFAGDLRFKGSDADRGLRIVVGETEEELAEFAGEAIATRLVGDPAAFLSELGERGVAEVGDLSTGLVLTSAARLDEVVRDAPTFLVAGDLAAPSAFMNGRGRISEADPSELLYPWRRFDLLDEAAPQQIDKDQSRRFSSHEAETPIWEYRHVSGADEASPLFSGIPELGPWPTQFGAFVFFTDRALAERYLAEGRSGNMAWAHRRGVELTERPTLLEVECLRERIGLLARMAGPTTIVLNPSGPRADVAFGRTDSPLIRTTAAIFEVMPKNVISYLRPWAAWSGRDTFHWPGAMGIHLDKADRTSAATRPIDISDLDEIDRSELVREAMSE